VLVREMRRACLHHVTPGDHAGRSAVAVDDRKLVDVLRDHPDERVEERRVGRQRRPSVRRR
jgi:hypothetical protein